MRKIELLAPAGDLERLKYAVIYGADAVFIGGKEFSLRSMASNFTLDDIKEGCEFAHAHNARVHVTCNIVMHENDTDGILEYLKALESCGVDAIIASSPTILLKVKKYTKMEAHVSTQQSVSNSLGVAFFEKIAANRVVLARECTISDIKKIKENSNIDLEVFIEGGMCASVSGRCMLSNIMTNRDANRGGCAQSCRWNYDIYQDNKKVSPGEFDFTMSSADLTALEQIPALIDAGVTSLKIEGRMKTLHYIATVVNAYRRCIDEYYETGKIEHIDEYKEAIAKGQNRQVSHGFLLGPVTNKEEIYDNTRKPSHEFIGIVQSYDINTQMVTMELRNYFESHREMEIFSPKNGRQKIFVDKLFDENNNEIEIARHPKMLVKFKVDFPCEQFDLVR